MNDTCVEAQSVHKFAELIEIIEDLLLDANINVFNRNLSKLLYELSEALRIEDTEAEELLVKLRSTIKQYLKEKNYE